MKFRIFTGIVVACLCTFLVWWVTFRFYVPPGYMAIVTAKVGFQLPPGQILAAPGQQGIQEAVLGEGRHFLNPFFYDWELAKNLDVPAGKVGIVVSKVGNSLPEGEFLAEVGQKGIWRQVLGPGTYRLNPYGYEVTLVDVISIPIGYVGVVTGLSGTQAPPDEFAGFGTKGVRKDVLQPGLYYINPKELRVDILEIGVNQVSLLGDKGGKVITKANITVQSGLELSQRALSAQQEKRRSYMASRSLPLSYTQQDSQQPQQVSEGGIYQHPEAKTRSMPQVASKPSLGPGDTAAVLDLYQVVEFPSRDGFEISLDMTVEFELLPEHIAWIYKNYGDLPAVVDNIIMPQILSVSRLKGSAYRAKDFIVGAGREQFQKDLTATLAKTLDTKHIKIHNALIRHVNVPQDILNPIQQASIASEQNLTNKEKQNTARKLAELNTETSLIAQRREQVAQETEKLKAEIHADQEKQVAEIEAKMRKQVAEIQKQTAVVRADQDRILGEAKADVVTMVEGERAHGLTLNAAIFGDPKAYTMWEFAINFNPNTQIDILHSGEGTFWTNITAKTLRDILK
ncbi:hypothetical protein TI04_01605 [Achromatium sp. WMS2]|nr:hypothetical protein TI04_01605 [Achromatium sp. WMS2]